MIYIKDLVTLFSGLGIVFPLELGHQVPACAASVLPSLTPAPPVMGLPGLPARTQPVFMQMTDRGSDKEKKSSEITVFALTTTTLPLHLIYPETFLR